MKYKGSCHCGKVAFEVEGELNGAMACNCSMCSRKGSLLWFVPRDQLHVLNRKRTSARTRSTSTSSSTVFVRRVAFIRTERAPIRKAIG